MAILLHRFFNDSLTQIIFLLVILDLALGITAGLVKGTFRLSYVSDFLRADILGRVVPFFLIYGGYVYAQSADIVIPGLDLSIIKDGAFAFALAALVGSLLGSLKDLGIPVAKQLPAAIAGPDPATPEVPPNPPAV